MSEQFKRQFALIIHLTSVAFVANKTIFSRLDRRLNNQLTLQTSKSLTGLRANHTDIPVV